MTLEQELNTPGRTQETMAEVDENKKTILIYSPDLNFCFSLSLLFQDRYNVITTTNPGTLGSFVQQYAADLVIVDAVPSEKVIERIDSLKEQNKCLPIIMLYVYSAKDVQLDMSIRNHVDSVFYKPFDLAPFSQRIDELLT
ncbi:MAG TPA: hypothetical protein VFG32_00510 [Bacteroidota bacterium]|jgi:DNA-binding response OmpR family regulator|nr:hypothetical protein [Bacteroidota bacterium]